MGLDRLLRKVMSFRGSGSPEGGPVGAVPESSPATGREKGRESSGGDGFMEELLRVFSLLKRFNGVSKYKGEIEKIKKEVESARDAGDDGAIDRESLMKSVSDRFRDLLDKMRLDDEVNEFVSEFQERLGSLSSSDSDDDVKKLWGWFVESVGGLDNLKSVVGEEGLLSIQYVFAKTLLSKGFDVDGVKNLLGDGTLGDLAFDEKVLNTVKVESSDDSGLDKVLAMSLGVVENALLSGDSDVIEGVFRAPEVAKVFRDNARDVAKRLFVSGVDRGSVGELLNRAGLSRHEVNAILDDVERKFVRGREMESRLSVVGDKVRERVEMNSRKLNEGVGSVREEMDRLAIGDLKDGLDVAARLAREAEHEVPDVLSKEDADELSKFIGDDERAKKLKDALRLFEDGGDGVAVVDGLIDRIDGSDPDKAFGDFNRIRAALDGIKRSVFEAVMDDLKSTRGFDIDWDEFGDGDVEVSIDGSDLVFRGSYGERLKKLLSVVRLDRMDDNDAMDLVGKVLGVGSLDRLVLENVLKKMKGYQKEGGVVKKTLSIVDDRLRKLRDVYRGRGRESAGSSVDRVTLDIDPNDPKLGDLKFMYPNFESMSRKEQAELWAHWSGLDPADRVRMMKANRRLRFIPEFSEDNPFKNPMDSMFRGAFEGGHPAGGFDDSTLEAFKNNQDALKRKLEDLITGIMRTGEPSRSDQNRTAFWQVYQLLSNLENSELRDKFVLRMLWHDIYLSIPGIGPTADLLKLSRWVPPVLYDMMFDMVIDFKEAGFNLDIKAKNILKLLERRPDGSGDIWLGRILGSNTLPDMELEKRRFMLAVLLDSMRGVSYRFDNGRFVVTGLGSDELEGLFRKFGLSMDGVSMLDSIPEKNGIRGEYDVFKGTNIEWMINTAVSAMITTNMAYALEADGHRYWKYLPNDPRKAFGRNMLGYVLKKVKVLRPWMTKAFDNGWRSFIGWGFSNMLSSFEGDLKSEGLSGEQVKSVVGFLKKVLLTSHISPEVRSAEWRIKMLHDGKFDKLINKLVVSGVSVDSIYNAIGWDVSKVDVGDASGDDRSRLLLRYLVKNISVWDVIRIANLPVSKSFEHGKYTGASREGFGSKVVELGDAPTPEGIAEWIEWVRKVVGLGTDAARDMGEELLFSYLKNMMGDLRGYVTPEARKYGWVMTKDGKVWKEGGGVWDWNVFDKNGRVMKREAKLARKLGYVVDEDGWVRDPDSGSVVHRMTRKRWNPIEKGRAFGRFANDAEFIDIRRIIKGFAKKGLITEAAASRLLDWIDVLLAFNIKLSEPPKGDKWFERSTNLAKAVVKDSASLYGMVRLLGLPLGLSRVVYHGVLMSDTFSELDALTAPLWKWFGNAVSNY